MVIFHSYVSLPEGRVSPRIAINCHQIMEKMMISHWISKRVQTVSHPFRNHPSGWNQTLEERRSPINLIEVVLACWSHELWLLLTIPTLYLLYMYICIYVYTCIYVHICVYMYICIYMYICAYMCIYVFMYIHVYMYTCIRIYIYICM